MRSRHAKVSGVHEVGGDDSLLQQTNQKDETTICKRKLVRRVECAVGADRQTVSTLDGLEVLKRKTVV